MFDLSKEELESFEKWLKDQPSGFVIFMQDFYYSSQDRGFEPTIVMRPRRSISVEEVQDFERYLSNLKWPKNR